MILLLLKSILLAVGACGILLLLKKASAASRCGAIAIAFLSMILLPLSTSLIPEHPVQVPLSDSSPVLLHFHPVGRTDVTPARQVQSASVDYIVWFQWIWACGAALLLLRLTFSLLRLHSLIARSHPLQNDVSIADVSVPCTAWWKRSLILVPLAFQAWPDDLKQNVLAHERAHIKRADWQWQFAMRVVCCFMWPNLFAWVLMREAKRLAEHAADDVVLAGGTDPARYARDLINVLRASQSVHPVLSIPMAAQPDLKRRIKMIMKPNRRIGGVHFGVLAVAAAVLGLGSLPIASMALVGQKQKSPRPSQLQEARLPTTKSMHAKWITAGLNCTECHRATGKHTYEIPFTKKFEKWTVDLKSYQFKTTDSIVIGPLNPKPLNKDGVAFTIPTASLPNLVASLQKSGTLLNSPRMLTYSGQKATIQFSNQNPSRDEPWQRLLSVTPTVLGEKVVQIRFAIVDLYAKQPSDKSQKFDISMQADGEIMVRAGQAMAITEKRGKFTYLTILQPSIIVDK